MPMGERFKIWESCIYVGMSIQEPAEMARRRALLTDRERELIQGKEEVDENYRYQAISRVRNKVQDELPTDVEILKEHHPTLLNELREVVCEDNDN
jgi:hypothetical protein